MKYTNIFEKILFLFQVIGSSWIYIAFAIFLALLIVLLVLKKISKKTSFILTTLATNLLLGYTIYNNYSEISKTFNSLIDNIFKNIYFPSTYVYLFVLLTINIIAIGSLLKKKLEKVYKYINAICLIITNFTFILIIEIIAKNQVDIFSKKSLFTNTDLITLLEFSINIFIIWLIALITSYLINTITERITIARENKKLVTNPAVMASTELIINTDSLQEEYQTANKHPSIKEPTRAIAPKLSENKFIPNFTVSTVKEENKFIPSFNTTTIKEENKFIPVLEVINDNNNYSNSFDLSAFIPKKQEVQPININELTIEQEANTSLLTKLEPIKEIPKEVSLIEEQKNAYTLNDYRIFNKMLKDIKEHNGSNSITIDKNLEYRLITKYSTKNYDMFKTMLKIYS